MNKFIGFCMTALIGGAWTLSAGAATPVNLSSSAIETTATNIITGKIDKPEQKKYLYLTTKAEDPLKSGVWDDVICYGNIVEVTLEWESPVTADMVKVYFQQSGNNYVPPQNVKFYTGDGFSEEIAWTEGENNDNGGNEAWHEYVFKAPQTLNKIKFYQQSDTSNLSKSLFLRRLWVLNASGAVGCAHEHTTTNGCLAATCTTAGSTGTETCDECGETIRAAEVIPALGHDWSEWTVLKAATKEETGLKSRTCQRAGCGEVERAVIPKIADIAALRNVAVATAVGAAPVLPATVRGLLADGTLTEGEFDVVWPSVAAPAVEGVTRVTGTVDVDGQPMEVTASIRAVTLGSGDLVNIAQRASSMTVDIDNADEINGNRGSFDIVKEAVNITNNWGGTVMVAGGWNTPNSQFSCYWHSYQGSKITVNFTWGSAQQIKQIFVAERNGNDHNGSRVLKDGSTGTEIPSSAYEFHSHYDRDYTYYKINQGDGFLYVFDQPLTLSALTIEFTAPPGSVGNGLYGIEVFAEDGAKTVKPLTRDTLDDLKVDGVTVAGFAPTTYSYTALGGRAITAATARDNMGVTVLPMYENYAYAVTLAEDGESTQVYSVQLQEPVKPGFAVIVEEE